ncbi:MAG: glycoside hydrolase family 36 N-terminal domain-containing protein [Ilumatobacteraceae bacterium]
MPSPVHLTDGRVSIVIGLTGGCTDIVYWGAPLGTVDLAALQIALRRPISGGALDVEAPASLVPEHGSGYPGRPGLADHRPDGTGWAPRFEQASTTVDADRAAIVGRDDVAGLELETRVGLDPSGVLRARATVTNVGDSPYTREHLELTVALPAHAVEASA